MKKMSCGDMASPIQMKLTSDFLKSLTASMSLLPQNFNSFTGLLVKLIVVISKNNWESKNIIKMALLQGAIPLCTIEKIFVSLISVAIPSI